MSVATETRELIRAQKKALFQRWLDERRYAAGETFAEYLDRVREEGSADRVGPPEEPWLEEERERTDLHG